jgi:hypothetical protein
MNTPALIQVRQRRTAHGAERPPIIEDWREAYADRQRDPSQSEAADFGEGDSTGMQSLD